MQIFLLCYMHTPERARVRVQHGRWDLSSRHRRMRFAMRTRAPADVRPGFGVAITHAADKATHAMPARPMLNVHPSTSNRSGSVNALAVAAGRPEALSLPG